MTEESAQLYFARFDSVAGDGATDMQLFADDPELVHYYIRSEAIDVFIAWRQSDELTLFAATGGYEESPRIDEVVDFVDAVVNGRAHFIRTQKRSRSKPYYTLVAPTSNGLLLEFRKYREHFETWEQRLAVLG